VISLLIENSNEVILTIKKRPRHAMNMLGHIYLRPRIPNRKKSNITVSPIVENNVFPSSNSNSTDAEDSANSSDLSQLSEKTKEMQANDLSKEPSPSPAAASHAETRFWKLYPRPRNLIKRRATVTGASPTSTRPPVTFIDVSF